MLNAGMYYVLFLCVRSYSMDSLNKRAMCNDA